MVANLTAEHELGPCEWASVQDAFLTINEIETG